MIRNVRKICRCVCNIWLEFHLFILATWKLSWREEIRCLLLYYQAHAYQYANSKEAVSLAHKNSFASDHHFDLRERSYPLNSECQSKKIWSMCSEGSSKLIINMDCLIFMFDNIIISQVSMDDVNWSYDEKLNDPVIEDYMISSASNHEDST